MNYYAGIDVSLERSSVCVVDGSGKIIREGKVASEPEALIAWFNSLNLPLERIGIEAGPERVARSRNYQEALAPGIEENSSVVELADAKAGAVSRGI